jgi:hypothetical protein
MREKTMIYSYEINGLLVQTGDIICTTDGAEGILPGEFWRLLGKLVPGDVDHIAIYTGPKGRCVESGARGVVTFEVKGGSWIAEEMQRQRGPFVDTLYGIAYPLMGRELSKKEEARVRIGVADYCLDQAAANKPYNLNFLNPQTGDAFYCSQLAYKAYLSYGIDLNTGQGVPNLKGTSSIIFPQEIWSGCPHRGAPGEDVG